MRLLHTFHDDREARSFSSFLADQKIENQLEISKNTDWGSDHYGDLVCKIWVIEEDDFAASMKLLEQYRDNPGHERFKPYKATGIDYLKVRIPTSQNKELPKTQFTPHPSPPPPPPPRSQSVGTMTLYLILTCSIIFFVSMMTSRTREPYPSKLPPLALFSSKIEKTFYFDYPAAFEIIDKLINAYGFEKVINPQLLPPEGKHLLNEYLKTPYWEGFYPKILSFFKTPGGTETFQAPLFEKIREGEFWRLFTPCLLHVDLFHLFFNMIWLIVLGRQIEQRIGIPRYLLFILLTGVASNTAQYFMSGSNFAGFSGVLCGMIAFVWFRQKKAPWEGYQLLPATLKFITAFVLIMLALQVVSFLLEVFDQKGLPIAIANTAHIAGAFIGFLLAKSKFFTWRMRA